MDWKINSSCSPRGSLCCPNAVCWWVSQSPLQYIWRVAQNKVLFKNGICPEDISGSWKKMSRCWWYFGHCYFQNEAWTILISNALEFALSNDHQLRCVMLAIPSFTLHTTFLRFTVVWSFPSMSNTTSATASWWEQNSDSSHQSHIVSFYQSVIISFFVCRRKRLQGNNCKVIIFVVQKTFFLFQVKHVVSLHWPYTDIQANFCHTVHYTWFTPLSTPTSDWQQIGPESTGMDSSNVRLSAVHHRHYRPMPNHWPHWW